MVPFHGSAEEGRALLEALRRLSVAAGDEIVVSDNTEDARFPAEEATPPVRVCRAPLERSSYYARNVGVEATAAPWLLFVDSDTRPAPDVIDAYLTVPPAEGVGVLAGGVLAASQQTSLVARYARSRSHIDPEHYRREDRRPAGITANLLVRREAWDSVGGFHEGIRSGADIEFCWRLQDAGWGFDWRTEARVEHLHVESVGALARKAVRHAGGGAWINRRYPGAFARPRILGGLARCAVGVPLWVLAGRPERAAFKALDAVFLTTDAFGRLTGNRADRDAVQAAATSVALVNRFPERGTTLSLGPETPAYEVLSRPSVPDRAARRALDVTYLEDDGALARGRDAVWLVIRRPRCARAAVRRYGCPGMIALAPALRRAAARGLDVYLASGVGDARPTASGDPPDGSR